METGRTVFPAAEGGNGSGLLSGTAAAPPAGLDSTVGALVSPGGLASAFGASGTSRDDSGMPAASPAEPGAVAGAGDARVVPICSVVVEAAVPGSLPLAAVDAPLATSGWISAAGDGTGLISTGGSPLDVVVGAATGAASEAPTDSCACRMPTAGTGNGLDSTGGSSRETAAGPATGVTSDTSAGACAGRVPAASAGKG
ncbi:MAG TPA: hypothetical protein PLO14_05325 [Accumulibacter sp.]|uniref:hypothetical protein n=1 Tax=Accumulibacter sp. TaxID=2053492 RepID=UPI0025DC743B|nr:hypothetical protein [Accumulibacter sp.]MCM8600512.1 hypothetical protein [Accumulibacter sp.]MCM8663760.1 hypothetical protein [Accumulibacter sp.]HNC51646.1 hypothetical protein [Accumulibacter sp.]